MGYLEGVQSSDCAHDQRFYYETRDDGTQVMVVYCIHCGMEWE